MITITAVELARRIDHTLLKPEAVPAQIDAWCDEALRYGFAAVCVNPVHVRRAVDRLGSGAPEGQSDPRPVVASVAGFPLGASTTATKVDEARRAIDDGAVEIDMVAFIGALVSGEEGLVRRDIDAVARTVHAGSSRRILKVILETGVLTTGQIAIGCRCCVEGGADFVKTSTGFHSCGGATVEHVRLLKRQASPLLVNVTVFSAVLST